MDGHVENSINLTTILIAEQSIQHAKEKLETTPISKLNAVFLQTLLNYLPLSEMGESE